MLFTLSKRWKEPNIAPVGEWMKKYGRYCYSNEMLLSLKKERNYDMCKTGMNFEDFILVK